MPEVTAIRAVNVPVEDEEVCLAFYRDRLGMLALPDVLPGGTMCRWERDYDQFLGVRAREASDRRWRYPYGRCADWDHVELHLRGSTDALSPVETHSEALVLADPEERAIEALLSGRGTVEIPGIAEVGLAVGDVDETRAYYADLGFEPVGWEDDDRFVLRAASGQRWVLLEGHPPGFHHVSVVLDRPRFRDARERLAGDDRSDEGDRIRVEDPGGRTVVLLEAEDAEPASASVASGAELGAWMPS